MKATSREFFQRYLPVGAIAVVFLLGFQTLSPFLPALMWSLFVSVAIFNLYNNLADRLGGKRGIATLITVVSLFVVVLLPMLLLLRSIVAVLPELATLIVEEGSLEKIGVNLPASMPPTWQSLWENTRDDLEAMRDIIGGDLRLLLSAVVFEGRLIGYFVLEFLLGLVLAAVILQNASPLIQLSSQAALKLGSERGVQLMRRSVRTIRYTVLGILGSAAVQTALAAFSFWVVGAPHWPLLAFASFLLGLLQVGPVLVWGPIAIWLWLQDNTGMAIFLSVWGLIVVGLSDNAVKSLVVARGADLPTVLVFLGAVGGLLMWGIVGIFLGPVVLALCMELAVWWLEEEGKTDERVVLDDENIKETGA